MKSFDLYGIKAEAIFEARLIIERLLSVALAEHDSLYQSGLYFRVQMTDGTEMKLKLNRDPFDDEPDEEGYPSWLYLLYVNGTDRPDVFREALAKSGGAVTLLQHEEL